MQRLLLMVIGSGAAFVFLLYAIANGWFGTPWQPANPNPVSRPAGVAVAASETTLRAASLLGVESKREVLFGDLHVHTTFSIDALFMSLPSAGGDGLHPVSDACDFARYCSALDFFSINDHAESLSRPRWQNTIDEIRQCNAVSNSDEPDLVAFMGWEWTQAGFSASSHFGHKNVIIKGLADDDIPTRPISSVPVPGVPPQILGQPSFLLTGLAGLINGGRQELLSNARDFRGLEACEAGVPVRDLPPDCMETAATPEILFDKLNDWNMETMVIPHGTTWGMYTPPGSDWRKQLNRNQHDPNRQRLIEIYSGHGNSEEYRAFNEALVDDEGNVSCPEPANNFVPGCWRAGEIAYERCVQASYSARQCNALAAEARQNFVSASFNAGDKVIPGTEAADWLDAGQCLDCFMPSFNYRPRGSAQYILALRNFDETGAADRFRFGFVGGSDNHSARPGTGYKEFARSAQTEARFDQIPGVLLPPYKKPAPAVRSVPIMEAPASPFVAWNFERAASWFMSGGLVAVHSASRRRHDIWDALVEQQVYATSGPRILLWFSLESAAGELPMGSEVTQATAPVFKVQAMGSFEQAPGCPDFATDALTSQRMEALCNGECFNPTSTRRPITRIEVIRIRPQVTPKENIATLVDDPWRVLECPGTAGGCSVEFTDEDFTSGQRDSIYYVRAVEATSMAIGAQPYVCERDSAGNCTRIGHMCADAQGDCLAPTEERAWSSPIYVNYRRQPDQTRQE